MENEIFSYLFFLDNSYVFYASSILQFLKEII